MTLWVIIIWLVFIGLTVAFMVGAGGDPLPPDTEDRD